MSQDYLTKQNTNTPRPPLSDASIYANATTPSAVSLSPRPSTFKVETPSTIPSRAVSSGSTYNDVLARRNEMEQEQVFNQQLDGEFDALEGRINQDPTPFSDPDTFLNRLLLNQPTDTQTELDQARLDQADRTRQFSEDIQDARDVAREDYDVTGLQDALSNTRNQIAERQVRLREDLRRLETNPEGRGVAREFVQAERQKIKADAAAELADLAIIESAQTGNLQLALDQVNDLISEKARAYEFENQAIEQEIARLDAMDTRESNRRSEKLQIALQERNRQIEQSLSNEKEIRNYLVQAGAEGADQQTLAAIRNAATPNEAALLASPWIGRTDRLLLNAQIKEIQNSINEKLLEKYESEDKARMARNTQAEKAEIVIGKVSEALGQVSGVSTGFIGGTSEIIPATPAYNLSKTIDTIQANLGFDTLQAMRDASPTGGALGQVSEREIGLLQSTVASLEVGQSKEQLQQNLNQITEHYKNWLETVGLHLAPDGTVVEIVTNE